jgi:ribosomal protein S21
VQQEDTIKEVNRYFFYLKPRKKRVMEALARKRSAKLKVQE